MTHPNAESSALRALAQSIRDQQDPRGDRTAQELFHDHTNNSLYSGIGSLVISPEFGAYLQVVSDDSDDMSGFSLNITFVERPPEGKLTGTYVGTAVLHQYPEGRVRTDIRIDPELAEEVAGPWLGDLAQKTNAQKSYGNRYPLLMLEQPPTAEDLAKLNEIAADPNGVHGYTSSTPDARRGEFWDDEDRVYIAHLPKNVG
jgi:hypothetical protein